MFDELPDRYHVRESLTAVDLDGDGLDEIVATFNHAESAPSYTVVYEPTRDRARTVFYGWGNQDIAGVADLDGDGRPELLIAGINNGFGWYNELAAVRIDPPIGADGVVSAAVSPESAAYPEQRKDLLWYTLLPPGRFIELQNRVRADPARKRLDVYFEDRAPVGIGFDGFRLDEPSSTPAPDRAAARDRAYRAAYEARRLAAAGFAPAALRQGEDAVRQAALAEDGILAECMARQRARLLVGVGREREGLGLFDALAGTSPNASDIAFDAARALHLRGALEPAERWYARGLGPGGRVDVGKSKWEFAEGALLALGEQHRWVEARRWLDRFLGSYPEFRGWVSIYREYINWRSGETVHLQEVADSPRTTVQMRYWLMEYRARTGEAAASLLVDVEKELEQPSEMRGELRSLEGVLLARLGRRQESEVAERLAFEEVRRRLGTSVLARAHVDLVAERLERAVGGREAASTRELVAAVLRQLEHRAPGS